MAFDKSGEESSSFNFLFVLSAVLLLSVIVGFLTISWNYASFGNANIEGLATSQEVVDGDNSNLVDNINGLDNDIDGNLDDLKTGVDSTSQENTVGMAGFKRVVNTHIENVRVYSTSPSFDLMEILKIVFFAVILLGLVAMFIVKSVPRDDGLEGLMGGSGKHIDVPFSTVHHLANPSQVDALDYIHHKLELHGDKTKVREELLRSGWKPQDINEIFEAYMALSREHKIVSIIRHHIHNGKGKKDILIALMKEGLSEHDAVEKIEEYSN